MAIKASLERLEESLLLELELELELSCGGGGGGGGIFWVPELPDIPCIP